MRKSGGKIIEKEISVSNYSDIHGGNGRMWENDSNKTRFYVLSDTDPQTTQGQRLAYVASGSAKELPALMEEIRKQNMTLITVHDRPQKTELGEYDYILECADCSYQNYLKLEGKSGLELRFLGSFDVY